MKKLFIITSFFVFFLFVSTSHAQTPIAVPPPDSPIINTSIPKGISTSKLIPLPPFTRITIQPGSFSDKVQVTIYPGNWYSMKALIPEDQSPVSSYIITFLDSTGNRVYPAKPIYVESYENYVKSTAFFYPLDKNNNIDKANVKSFPGPLFLKINLLPQDPGFIVAVNIILDKKDPSLNPSLFQSKTTPPQGLAWISLTLLKNILPTILIVVAAFATIAYLFWQNKEKGKPRKKTGESSSKIIVGEK